LSGFFSTLLHQKYGLSGLLKNRIRRTPVTGLVSHAYLVLRTWLAKLL
jgi:hypothetical protein